MGTEKVKAGRNLRALAVLMMASGVSLIFVQTIIFVFKVSIMGGIGAILMVSALPIIGLATLLQARAAKNKIDQEKPEQK